MQPTSRVFAHRHSVPVYTARRDAAWADVAGDLSARHELLITDEHGPALRDFLRRAHATVWIEGPRHAPVQRVLAAVDPFAPAPITSAVLDVARALTSAPDAQLLAVHAWSAPGEALIAEHASPARARGYVDAQRALALRALARTLEPLGDAVAACFCLRGEPVGAIEYLVGELAIDAVVLGITPRSRLARVLLGCTAERVARSVECHVVVARPPAGADAITELPRAVARAA